MSFLKTFFGSLIQILSVLYFYILLIQSIFEIDLNRRLEACQNSVYSYRYEYKSYSDIKLLGNTTIAFNYEYNGESYCLFDSTERNKSLRLSTKQFVKQISDFKSSSNKILKNGDKVTINRNCRANFSPPTRVYRNCTLGEEISCGEAVIDFWQSYNCSIKCEEYKEYGARSCLPPKGYSKNKNLFLLCTCLIISFLVLSSHFLNYKKWMLKRYFYKAISYTPILKPEMCSFCNPFKDSEFIVKKNEIYFILKKEENETSTANLPSHQETIANEESCDVKNGKVFITGKSFKFNNMTETVVLNEDLSYNQTLGVMDFLKNARIKGSWVLNDSLDHCLSVEEISLQLSKGFVFEKKINTTFEDIIAFSGSQCVFNMVKNTFPEVDKLLLWNLVVHNELFFGHYSMTALLNVIKGRFSWKYGRSLGNAKWKSYISDVCKIYERRDGKKFWCENRNPTASLLKSFEISDSVDKKALADTDESFSKIGLKIYESSGPNIQFVIEGNEKFSKSVIEGKKKETGQSFMERYRKEIEASAPIKIKNLENSCEVEKAASRVRENYRKFSSLFRSKENDEERKLALEELIDSELNKTRPVIELPAKSRELIEELDRKKEEYNEELSKVERTYYPLDFSSLRDYKNALSSDFEPWRVTSRPSGSSERKERVKFNKTTIKECKKDISNLKLSAKKVMELQAGKSAIDNELNHKNKITREGNSFEPIVGGYYNCLCLLEKEKKIIEAIDHTSNQVVEPEEIKISVDFDMMTKVLVSKNLKKRLEVVDKRLAKNKSKGNRNKGDFMKGKIKMNKDKKHVEGGIDKNTAMREFRKNVVMNEPEKKIKEKTLVKIGKKLNGGLKLDDFFASIEKKIVLRELNIRCKNSANSPYSLQSLLEKYEEGIILRYRAMLSDNELVSSAVSKIIMGKDYRNKDLAKVIANDLSDYLEKYL